MNYYNQQAPFLLYLLYSICRSSACSESKDVRHSSHTRDPVVGTVVLRSDILFIDLAKLISATNEFLRLRLFNTEFHFSVGFLMPQCTIQIHQESV